MLVINSHHSNRNQVAREIGVAPKPDIALPPPGDPDFYYRAEMAWRSRLKPIEQMAGQLALISLESGRLF